MTSITSPITTAPDSAVARDEFTTTGRAIVSANDHRAAAVVAFAGVALCVVGSILNQAIPGADVYGAMETASASERAILLEQVADAQVPLVAGFSVWMLAFPLTALASVLLARLGRQSTLVDMIRHLAVASIGAILVFLSAIITFVVVIAPAHVAGENVETLARTVGFFATTVDWVITAIVLGIGPIGAVYAGRDSWAPRWLQGLAGITAVATAVEVFGLVTDNRALLMPIVPIGLVLVACAGVAALRRSNG